MTYPYLVASKTFFRNITQLFFVYGTICHRSVLEENMAAPEKDTSEPKAPRIVRTARPRLRKALPNGRISFAKQLDILRAAAVASGIEHKPVSNEEVAGIVNIYFGSISNCNPFFLETGLYERQKQQNVPCDEVFAYAEGHKWDPEKSAHKLAPVIRKSWFCALLLPRITFRPVALDDAIGIFAAEAGASPEYKDQLAMLVEFMRVAGIIHVENGLISLAPAAVAIDAPKPHEVLANPALSIEKADFNESSGARFARGNGLERHPFIEGLLKTLPETDSEWSTAGRLKWLQAASNIFGLIYTTKDTDDADMIVIEKRTS
jgi:hypothetical protein